MGKAFYTGGPQDWQRKYRYADGTPGSHYDPVLAFQHSTSFILGFTTARSGIPLDLAERVGGALNLWRRVQGYPVDTSGRRNTNPEDQRSIEHGFVYWRADAFPPDRAYLDEQQDVAVAERIPTRLRNQIELNGATPRMQPGARDVQLASYRFAPSDDAPAMRALNAAKADDTFTKRYLKGDRDAVDRMHALHRAAYPEPGDQTVGPAARQEVSDNSAGGYSRETRDLTPARQALEAAKSDSGFVRRYLDGDRSAFDRMQSLIQAAYPEPEASGGDNSKGGASTPMFQPWTPEAATEGLTPWMQSSLKDTLSSPPDDDGDGYSKLAPWMRDQYPALLRGNGG